jgi:GST-like protein
MSMLLYHGQPNGPSLTVLAALFETGVEARLEAIALDGGTRHALGCAEQDVVAMSIEGEGPVLVVDGEPMTDSVFIACYLDDLAGGGVIRPAEPYARWEMMCWCRQLTERAAPAASLLGCRAAPPRADTAMIDRVVSDDLRARWIAARAGDFSDEQLADSRGKIAQAVDKVEARLDGREWLLGGFSIADLETYAWLAGMELILPDAFAARPATAAWLARVRGRPSVAKALSLATMADPRMVWAPGPEINRWG